MASPEEEADVIVGEAADDDLTYDDPLVHGELEQELNSDFLHNPHVSTSSKQLKKEKPEAERKENEDGKLNNLKSSLLFSGVVVAIIGALFAVLKKIKET